MAISKDNITIAIDAMGGDLGPSEVVEAVALVLQEAKGLSLVLVGQEEVIKPLITQKGLGSEPRLSIHHAPTIITMDDKPKESFKTKKDSSMLQVIDLVKSGTANGAVSCGNTGSLMFSGTLMLRKLPGVERPALATIIPSHNHRFLLLDAGAQPEATALQLAQNAILGNQYAKSVLGYDTPRVGLLTIGTEEGKGTEKIIQTHELLKKLDSTLNYIGPIEGFDTFQNVADVIVCDGFTGNIVLKTLESCYDTLSGVLKQELTASLWRKLGALISQGAFKAMKQQFSPEQYAGAPLLGLKSIIVKTHGSSNRFFIKHTILNTVKAVSHDISQQTENDIEKLNAIMKAEA